MSNEAFLKRLQNRRSVSGTYRDGDLVGLVNIWFDKDKYILTLEECKTGDQYNEKNYIRDEKKQFDNIDEVIGFLSSEKINTSDFTW
jgi:hypothetical protein